MKLSDIHDLDIGRLNLRWYSTQVWAFELSITWRMFAMRIWRLRFEARLIKRRRGFYVSEFRYAAMPKEGHKPDRLILFNRVEPKQLEEWQPTLRR